MAYCLGHAGTFRGALQEQLTMTSWWGGALRRASGPAHAQARLPARAAASRSRTVLADSVVRKWGAGRLSKAVPATTGGAGLDSVPTARRRIRSHVFGAAHEGENVIG
jgi:hypothetical protein